MLNIDILNTSGIKAAEKPGSHNEVFA